MVAGFFAALERSFAYRLAKFFPSGLVRWIDLVSMNLDQTVPVALLTVGGDGTKIALATYVPGVTLATFTVVHNSAGDISVTWPANTFRTATALPTAAVNEPTATTSVAIATKRIVNGAQVFTAAMPAAIPSDAGFVLSIYGQ